MNDPQNEESIFSKGKGITTVVTSFTEAPHLDFSIYGKGYYKAGKILAERLINGGIGYGDYDGYPIVFLFRHAFELYLKGCLNQIHYNAGLEQNKTLLDMVHANNLNHRLIPLAELLQQAIAIIAPNSKILKTRMDRVVEVAREFEKIDSDSFAFRYPTDKKNKPSTVHHLIINIQTLFEVVSEVINILETIDFGLIDQGDFIQERLRSLVVEYKESGKE